ncbi:MAG: hypothetical protein AAF570_27540, partial [Bacteroidota bacterium]
MKAALKFVLVAFSILISSCGNLLFAQKLEFLSFIQQRHGINGTSPNTPFEIHGDRANFSVEHEDLDEDSEYRLLYYTDAMERRWILEIEQGPCETEMCSVDGSFYVFNEKSEAWEPRV